MGLERDLWSLLKVFPKCLYLSTTSNILAKPVNLINNQENQISLLSVDFVPVQKELIFDSSKDGKVQIVLKINNSKAEDLGIPLPSGL